LNVIDADGAILGRLASDVAKQLLTGSQVTVVNAEKAVVTGDKRRIMADYKAKFDRGHRYKGPFFPKSPHRILKRTVRGMLPWSSSRGKEAYKRLKVELGVPEGIGKAEKVPAHSIDRSGALKFVRLGDVSKFLGWKPRA
jgi:large subunit ribosomal protein L13